MLYVNNPEALVAIETDRRRAFGMHATVVSDPTPPGCVARESESRHVG